MFVSCCVVVVVVFSQLTALELLPVVNRCGMAAVTMHGRTRQQRYTKAADYSYLRNAAKFAKEKCNGLQFIANGDVYSFEDYEELVNPESDVATCMIARGALVKPWSVLAEKTQIKFCKLLIIIFHFKLLLPLFFYFFYSLVYFLFCVVVAVHVGLIGSLPRSKSVVTGISVPVSVWICYVSM